MHQGIVSDGAFGSENVVMPLPVEWYWDRCDAWTSAHAGSLGCGPTGFSHALSRKAEPTTTGDRSVMSAVPVVLVALLEWAARVLERDGG